MGSSENRSMTKVVEFPKSNNIFTHKEDVNIPEIKAVTKDKIRLYTTPEGNEYPSITTVLSGRNKAGLLEWRNRVGNEVANYIARKAATRGTQVHNFCEDYINNKLEKIEEKKKGRFLAHCMFSQLKPFLDENIGLVHLQETSLWSDYYKLAGRVDCIAEYKGTLSVIDFKTSTKTREDSWNENYYIQGSAYAEMYQERTQEQINQIVILVVTEDGTVQEFIKDKKIYLHLLDKEIGLYYNEPTNTKQGFPGLLPGSW